MTSALSELTFIDVTSGDESSVLEVPLSRTLIATAADGESGLVRVSVHGANQLEDPVTGAVQVVLPMEIVA